MKFPLDNQSQGAIEQPQFDELKSRKFKGGFPIFTAVPTYTGIDGEMVLYQDKTNNDYRICIYLNGGWRKLGFIETTYYEAISATHPAGSNNWEDWDISALVASGTKYADIMMVNTTATSRTMGVRKDGSALTRTVGILGNVRVIFTVEVSASGIIEIITDDYNNSAFQVVGYWK